jgi:hypothetical protein
VDNKDVSHLSSRLCVFDSFYLFVDNKRPGMGSFTNNTTILKDFRLVGVTLKKSKRFNELLVDSILLDGAKIQQFHVRMFELHETFTDNRYGNSEQSI